VGGVESDAFTTWWEGVETDIVQIQEILAHELSDNPGELMRQLTRIEAWHGRMTSMKAWASSFLAQAEKAVLMERADGWTDLDRKSDQKWKTATERRVTEIMEGMVDGIKNRLILGMALMKAQGGERFSGRSLS
jgi:hypothetical protein